MQRTEMLSDAFGSEIVSGVNVGGHLMIAQDVIDAIVEAGDQHLVHGVATPPRLEELTIQFAHGLLVNWGHEPTSSRRSKWHKIGAILLGVDNGEINLRFYMDAFQQVATSRQK